MKKLNKVIAGLLCGALVLSPVQANAQEDATASSSTEPAVVTTIDSDFDTVTVTATLSEGVGATSGRVSLDLDPSQLSVKSFVTGEFTESDFNKDDLSFAWVSEEAVNEETELFTITFEATDAKSGEQIEVTSNVDELYAEDTAVEVAPEVLDTTISLLDIASIKAMTYTGAKLTPAVSVSHEGIALKNGKDYSVSYKDNKNAGTATVTVTGKGKYRGRSNTATFTINAKKITSKNATLSVSTFPIDVNSAEINANVKVDGKNADKDGMKFTVTDEKGNAVADNKVTASGKYTMTMVASGNYTGKLTKSFTVTKREIRIFGHLITCIWTIK